MLGNAYDRSAAGDYDPESPRPNGVTGTLGPSSVVPGGASSEGGTHFGSASRGVFGPPPLPSVNPPAHSAFAPTAGRFVPSAPPGLPGTTGGSAMPLWPPSKIPTLGGKPPRTFSGNSQPSQASVSRTTSLHSDFGGPRLSTDDLGAVNPSDSSPGAQVLMPEQQYSHHHQNAMSGGEEISQAVDQNQGEGDGHSAMEGQFISHDNKVFGWQQHVHPEHSQMPSFGQGVDFSGSQGQGKKKPPPAIAKESPLKALYAKGGEKHLDGRRKISLNASLDAAALPLEDKPGYILPDSLNTYAPEAMGATKKSIADDVSGATNAPPPVFQHNFGTSVAPPPQSQPQEKSHSFNHEPAGFQSFQHSVPQTMEELSTAEETHGTLQSEVSSRHKGTRKRRGLWPGRRILSLYFLFCLYAALNPNSAVRNMTVAGLGMHAWLSGFLLSSVESYHGMKAEYDTLTSAHVEWSTMIESIYSHSYQASETSWNIVERKVICDTHKHICRLGKAIVHAPIAISLLSKVILTDMARNIPHLWKLVYHVAQSSISVSKDLFASIRSKEFKKLLPTIAGDSRKLLIAGKDFALCAVLKAPRGIDALDVFDNMLKCWISSFESFLAEKAPFVVDYADTGIDQIIKEVENEELMKMEINNYTVNETDYIEETPASAESQEDESNKEEDNQPGNEDSYSEYYPQYPDMDQFESNDSRAHPPIPRDTQHDSDHQIKDKEGFSSEDAGDNSGVDKEISREDHGKAPASLELPREAEDIQDDEDIILKRLKRQEEISSPSSGATDETNDFDDEKIGPPQPADSSGMADTLDLDPTSEPSVISDDVIVEAPADQTKDREEEIGEHTATREEDAIKKSLLSPRTDEIAPIEEDAQIQAEDSTPETVTAKSLKHEQHVEHSQEEEDADKQTRQLEFLQTQLLWHLSRASNAIKQYIIEIQTKAGKSLESLKKNVSIDVGHLMTAVIGAITAVSIVWLKDVLSKRRQGSSRMTILTTPSAVIHARKSSADDEMKAAKETVGDPLPVGGVASQSSRPARNRSQPLDTTKEDANPVSPRPRGRRASAAGSTSASRSRSKSATATARTRKRAASKASDAS